MSEKEPVFSYCVGRPWDDKEPNKICCYAEGDSVFLGTQKSAEIMRDYVRRVENDDSFEIYELKLQIK